MGTIVTIDIPSPTWERFVQATGKQQRRAQDVLVRLLQDYANHDKQPGLGSYGQLTYRDQQGTLPSQGSINALQFGADVSRAIEAVYGTQDPLELIEQLRDRR